MTIEPRPSIKYLIDKNHTRADFADIIATLMEATSPKVEDGRIALRLICRSQEVRRFGKTFYITLIATGSNIVVKVQER